MKQFIALLTLVLFVFLSCELDPGYMEISKIQEESEPTERCINHVVGGVWIAPIVKIKRVNKEFTTSVFCNTGDHLVGAVSLQISYNPQIIKPNELIGDKGVDTDVFVLPYGGYAVNILPVSETEEILFIAAYHAYGVEPSEKAFLFDLHWIGQSKGITKVTPNIIELIAFDPATYEYYTPGTPKAYSSLVCIVDLEL